MWNLLLNKEYVNYEDMSKVLAIIVTQNTYIHVIHAISHTVR